MSKVSGLVKSSALAALLLGATPLLAQDNSSDAGPPPAAADAIGPRELSNFSLNGTVTRQAQQPAAEPPAPAPREPAAASSRPAQSSAVRTAPSRQVATSTKPDQASTRAASEPLPTSVTLAPAQSAAPTTSSAPESVGSPVLVPTAVDTSSGFSPLPWIVALLLLGGAAAVYFGVQRRRQQYAPAAPAEYFSGAPEAAPRPQPAPRISASPAEPLVRRPEPEADPVPSPAGTVTSSLRSPGAASAPPGVITSSLRPWIELELTPSQAMVTDDHAAIAFDVTIYNSGSAPARDVAVEACMINAGEQQDVQLSEFYTAAGAVRDKIPAVAPMARITLKSAVRLPRTSVREYEVEGRKLFMPMVAINSRYRWSSGEGQSAASFMVGRAANDSAKLAPLRLDQGARGWKGLAARRYEKGIRR